MNISLLLRNGVKFFEWENAKDLKKSLDPIAISNTKPLLTEWYDASYNLLLNWPETQLGKLYASSVWVLIVTAFDYDSR